MSKLASALWLSLSVCVVSVCLGCSGNGMLPVEGTVTLDGTPLEGAAISFVPAEGGRPCSGQTDEQGHFTLASYTANDGVPPGEYKVTVVKLDARRQAQAAPVEEGTEPGEQVMGSIEQATRFLTPKRYASPATTDLRVEVKENMERVQIDLKSGN
ncbi:carboxypeptidase-like regulatory domain-containing protein [Bremerella sp. JC770]|uniref:carboxypeptidase-like regulatory domain-containing protein n=1 Tax=Bremerella sp. JC770 TaxID=3232137 RepID=UPI00345B0B76